MSTPDNPDSEVKDQPTQEVEGQEVDHKEIETTVNGQDEAAGDKDEPPKLVLNGDSNLKEADDNDNDNIPTSPANGNPSGSIRKKKYKRRTKSRKSLANLATLTTSNTSNTSPPSPTSTSSPASPGRPQPSPRKSLPTPRSPRVTPQPPQLDASVAPLDLNCPIPVNTSPTDDDGPRPEGRVRSNAFYGRPQPPTPNFMNNNNNGGPPQVKRAPSYSEIVTGAATTKPRAGAPPTPTAAASSASTITTETGIVMPQHTFSGICRPSKFNWTKKGDPKYDCVKNNSRRFMVGFAETIGRRPTMEDCMVIEGTFRGCADEDYFAVFDGHGGRESACFAAEQLHGILADKLKSGNPVKSLKEAFAETNNLIKVQKIAGGTTACVVLFIGKKGYVANVGDTRAVLCRDGTTIRVSLDHKPELPAETSRIKNLGGTVTTTTNAAGHSTSRVNGMLAVSRALGDTGLQPYVSSEPEIHGPLNISTTDKNQFMVMACDGVWDVISDEEAVSIVAPIPDIELACRRLRDEAYSRGSTDNISVMVIRFPPFNPR